MDTACGAPGDCNQAFWRDHAGSGRSAVVAFVALLLCLLWQTAGTKVLLRVLGDRARRSMGDALRLL